MQFYGTWKEIRGKSLFCFTGALIVCSLLQRWSSISLLPRVDYSLICHTGAMHLQQLSCLGRLPLCLFREIAQRHGGEHFCLCAWFGIYVQERCKKRKFIKNKTKKTNLNKTQKQTNKKSTEANSTFSSRPRLKLHGRILIQCIYQVKKITPKRNKLKIIRLS